MTDEAILELARHPATREDGFRELVIKYQERLYSMIRRQVLSHEDTDDVMQNTFLKIFRFIGSFEGKSELYTWMYRIASNEIINHLNLTKKNRTEKLEVHDAQHAEGYMDTSELILSMETIVKDLPERQQMVFRMRYYDEMPYKEMAELLQLSEGALKASFHHAVKKIEEALKAKQIL